MSNNLRLAFYWVKNRQPGVSNVLSQGRSIGGENLSETLVGDGS